MKMIVWWFHLIWKVIKFLFQSTIKVCLIWQVKHSLKSLEVEPSPIGRYSSQRQLRSGFLLSVRWLVGWSVTDFPGEPRIGFLSFFAWMFLTIRVRNVHGGFSGKILDHSIITIQCQKQPFLRVFQLWAHFDGNLSHWWSLFML